MCGPKGETLLSLPNKATIHTIWDIGLDESLKTGNCMNLKLSKTKSNTALQIQSGFTLTEFFYNRNYQNIVNEISALK